MVVESNGYLFLYGKNSEYPDEGKLTYPQTDNEKDKFPDFKKYIYICRRKSEN